MSTITVLAPDYEAAKPAEVVPAPRSVPTDPVTITVIDNGKPNARELLSYVAEGLRQRLPVADIVVHSKPAASKPIDVNDAATIAARSHLVISGLGD